jgi:SAM-dependent methyltransferase
MTKQAEIDYFANMSPEARDFASRKPFSADQRGAYLVDIGQILSIIRPPPADLLDIGCGSGWTTAMFARSGYRAVGVDIAPAAIELARNTFGDSGAEFRVHDFDALPYESEFDTTVIYDCLHHSDDEKEVLRNVHRALRPGGEVIVAEPGKGHHQSDISQGAAAAHGVTEKDMPPAHTVPILRAVGFESIRVFPRVQYQLYEREPTGRIGGLLSRIVGKRAASLVKNLKNSLFPGINGIVSATKPSQ